MTQHEAAIEHIELLVTKLVSMLDTMLSMQSDLRAFLIERGKRDVVSDSAPVQPAKMPWKCGWSDERPHHTHSNERAMGTPWQGYICKKCADDETAKQLGLYRQVGQDRAVGE